MYLHRVKRQNDYHETDKGFVRIEFETNKDRFTEMSGKLIKAAADDALAAIREHLQAVREGIEVIEGALRDADEHPDPASLIAAMRTRTPLNFELVRAQTLAHNMRAGEDECLEMEEQLQAALVALRNYMGDWGMDTDWDDSRYGDGDIKKFLAERD